MIQVVRISHRDDDVAGPNVHRIRRQLLGDLDAEFLQLLTLVRGLLPMVALGEFEHGEKGARESDSGDGRRFFRDHIDGGEKEKGDRDEAKAYWDFGVPEPEIQRYLP